MRPSPPSALGLIIVPAPVGEPVIAGDDGAQIVAPRAGTRQILLPSKRRHDELIGGKRQPEANRSGPCPAVASN
jgi:hypothetical protein